MALDNPTHEDVDETVEEPIHEDVDESVEEEDDTWEDVPSDHPPVTSDTEDGSETFDDEEHESLGENLAMWVNQNQIKHNATDILLKLLQRHGHPDLPASARTLLQTVKNVEIRQISGMEYYYFGIDDQLVNEVRKCRKNNKSDLQSIDIALNVDGIPLHRDSTKSLWPILCAITNVSPVHVFPVALTYGPSKPNNLDFLCETITDLELLLQDGLLIDGDILPVCLKCIVCDAPARAMVKNVKLYAGYYGCDKCAQPGEHKGKMTYPESKNFEKRTDE